LPLNTIISRDKKVLYKASAAMENFVYEYDHFPSSWNELKEYHKIKRIPYSYIDFKPLRINNQLSLNLTIMGPVFKYQGKKSYFYYDYNKKEFFISDEKDR
jgi:hypothetical protein